MFFFKKEGESRRARCVELHENINSTWVSGLHDNTMTTDTNIDTISCQIFMKYSVLVMMKY